MQPESPNNCTNSLLESSVHRKILGLDTNLELVLRGATLAAPNFPGRDARVVRPHELPNKPGYSNGELEVLGEIRERWKS